MKALVLLFAGLVTTASPPRYELYDSANVLVTKPASWEECSTRAAAIGGWTCVMRQKFVTVGVCNDVPKPVPEPPQDSLEAVQDPNDDNVWRNMVPGWVPADYAEGCWKVGQVELKYDPEAPTDEPVHEPVCHPEVYPEECVTP